MTQLESLKTPLARADPLIVGRIEEVERYAPDAQRREITQHNVIVVIYKSPRQMIRRFTLDSTYNLLQPTYVLSLHGHVTAKLQLRRPAAFAHDDEEVVEDALLVDDFLPQLADHDNGETDETDDDKGKAAISIEEEDRAEIPEVDDPIVTYHVVRIEV
jgi:hypothetical protein